jgi:hypothetical protein
MKLIATAVVISLAIAVGAPGDVVLDQQYSFTSAIANSTNGDVTQVGQTFTAGVAGKLDHIDVYMFDLNGIFTPTGIPLLKVYNTASGLPTGAPLTTVTASAPGVPLNNPAFVTFDVSPAAIDVQIGQVLAFSVIASSGVGPYFLPNDQGQAPGYPGGIAVINYGSGWQQIAPPQDHSFKTYVLTGAAGELFGDYNGSGAIDAGDYVVWRKTLASGGTTLLHDATPGVVDANDYNYWRARYGNPPGVGAGAVGTSVPEPTPIALTAAVFAIVAPAIGRRRRCVLRRSPAIAFL